jgi:hypothetical protein
MEDVVRIVFLSHQVSLALVLLLFEDHLTEEADGSVLHCGAFEFHVLGVTPLLPGDAVTHCGVAKGRRREGEGERKGEMGKGRGRGGEGEVKGR